MDLVSQFYTSQKSYCRQLFSDNAFVDVRKVLHIDNHSHTDGVEKGAQSSFINRQNNKHLAKRMRGKLEEEPGSEYFFNFSSEEIKKGMNIRSDGFSTTIDARYGSSNRLSPVGKNHGRVQLQKALLRQHHAYFLKLQEGFFSILQKRFKELRLDDIDSDRAFTVSEKKSCFSPQPVSFHSSNKISSSKVRLFSALNRNSSSNASRAIKSSSTGTGDVTLDERSKGSQDMLCNAAGLQNAIKLEVEALIEENVKSISQQIEIYHLWLEISDRCLSPSQNSRQSSRELILSLKKDESEHNMRSNHTSEALWGMRWSLTSGTISSISLVGHGLSVSGWHFMERRGNNNESLYEVNSCKSLFLCSICYLPALYRCSICQKALFCSIMCLDIHEKTRCMKHVE